MKWMLLIGLIFSQWAGSEIKKSIWKTGKSKVKIQPQYESCKKVDLSSLDPEEISPSGKNTNAKFCFSCSTKEVFGFGELEETAQAIQSKTFMDKFRKRVIGQIESKIFQIKVLRACATGNRNWLSRQKVDWPLMKAVCKQKNKQLKSSIQTRWTEMRVNLALSQVNPDQIVTGKPHLSFPLSHAISDFSSIPKLTKKEQKTVKKRWADKLAKTPLDKLTPSEFKSFFLKGKPSKLTTRDRHKLRKSTWKMQKEARDAYFEITSEMPLLGYLKTGNPKKKELDEAFTKMEENLSDLLKEAKDSEGDEGFLLSFKPLVEELLREDKDYCFVAEKARIKAEKDGSLKNWMMLGAGVLAAVPCFITGPVGASVCLTAGMALGVVGYKEAQSATKKSLGRALTGKQFETMAGLNEKEKEELLAKLFLPLGAWGTTAVPARAASGAIAKAMTGSRRAFSSKSLAERKRLGEKSLGKSLNKKQVEALERAHRVGWGQKGKDGTPARIGNYTKAQLRAKSRILKQAGFSRAERQKLMKDGVAGSIKGAGVRLADIDKIQKIDPQVIKNMTPHQIRRLEPDDLVAMTDEQLKTLNQRQIQALKRQHIKAMDLAALSPEQLKQLTPEQLMGDLGESFADLNAEQLRALAENIDEFTEESLKSLSPQKRKQAIKTLISFDGLKEKTSSSFIEQAQELGVLTSIFNLTSLTNKHLHAVDIEKLSPETQLAIFGDKDVWQNLSGTQLKTLMDNPNLIPRGAFRNRDIEKIDRLLSLPDEIIQSFHPNNLTTVMREHKDFRSKLLSKLTDKQIHTMGIDLKSLDKSTQTQLIPRLSDVQVKAIDPADLKNLDESAQMQLIPRLSANQVKAINLADLESEEVITELIPRLEHHQLKNIEEVMESKGMWNDRVMKKLIETGKVWSLGRRTMAHIKGRFRRTRSSNPNLSEAEKLTALEAYIRSPNANLVNEEHYYFLKFVLMPKGPEGLSPEIIRQLPVREFTPEMLNKLNAEQIDAINLGAVTINSKDPEKIVQHLSPKELAEAFFKKSGDEKKRRINIWKAAGYMTKEQQAALGLSADNVDTISTDRLMSIQQPK